MQMCRSNQVAKLLPNKVKVQKKRVMITSEGHAEKLESKRTVQECNTIY